MSEAETTVAPAEGAAPAAPTEGTEPAKSNEAAPPTDEEPAQKKRKSRFGDAPEDAPPPAAAVPANPLAAAQQALVSAGMSPASSIMPGGAGNPNNAPLGAAGVVDVGGVSTGVDNYVKRGAYEAAPIVTPDVAVLEDNIITKRVEVPTEAVGLVIGRGGETIRQLQIKAGADIQVSRDTGAADGIRVIEIMGPPEEVGVAEMLIRKIVEVCPAHAGMALHSND